MSQIVYTKRYIKIKDSSPNLTVYENDPRAVLKYLFCEQKYKKTQKEVLIRFCVTRSRIQVEYFIESSLESAMAKKSLLCWSIFCLLSTHLPPCTPMG